MKCKKCQVVMDEIIDNNEIIWVCPVCNCIVEEEPLDELLTGRWEHSNFFD